MTSAKVCIKNDDIKIDRAVFKEQLGSEAGIIQVWELEAEQRLENEQGKFDL